MESRTNADRDRSGVSYGVYLAVPKWHTNGDGSVCSYKAERRWPYGRFGSLIAKSDRFPSIGPFVVTSDGNRFCRARIAACQSSSFRRRCGEYEIQRFDAFALTNGRRPLGNEWWLRRMIAIMQSRAYLCLRLASALWDTNYFYCFISADSHLIRWNFWLMKHIDVIYSIVIFQLLSITGMKQHL